MTRVLLEELIEGARSGRVVSFPTDTVPALAVRPDRAQLLFEAKRRQQDKPLILMGASPKDLWPFCSGTDEELLLWQQVADRYWPGAITLVLPASEKVPSAVNPTDTATIGLRVPNCAIARQILARTGPLATTSANLSGQPPLQTETEIEAVFPDVLVLLSAELGAIDITYGVPSTVAKWTVNGWEILRQGAVKLGLEKL